MKLFVFAHRGEAQEFLKYFKAKLVDNGSLYQDAQANNLILITGEGLFNALSALGPVIGRYPIEEVVNLGLAGSLDPERAAIGEAYSVRTIYGHSDGPLFHSYTDASSPSKVDLISSSKRVLSDQFANELSNFAPLTDREAWGLAKACSDKGVPFRALKLVSDIAGNGVDCLDIKEKALAYSSRLLEFYLESSKSKPYNAKKKTSFPLPMSFTQKARYLKLSDALGRLKFFDLESFEKSFLAREHGKTSPKTLANIFLDELELNLSPAKKEIAHNFEKLCSPLKSAGAKVLMDKAYEKKKFTIQMEVNNQQNLRKLSEALEKTNFEDFLRIWDGPSNV